MRLQRFVLCALLGLLAPGLAAAADSAEPTPVKRSDLDFLARAEADVRAADALPDTDAAARRRARHNALHLLAGARAIVGDAAGATQAFAESLYAYSGEPLPATTDTSPEDAEYVRTLLAGYTPEAALPGILGAARDRRIVILNEAHHESRHRAYGMEVALALRKLGFKYLAMETLDHARAVALNARGYPELGDGAYSRDPLFADFIRQALRAGYILVPYEWKPEQRSTAGGTEAMNVREESQANNLVAATFARDPEARVFVYVGFSHALKGTQEMGGKPFAFMAERLRVKSGHDPLSIDETKVTQPLPGTRYRALLDAIFARTRDASVVLADNAKAGTYYVTTPGRVDMQVFHRLPQYVNGRPDWLAMDGYRKPRVIPTELLPKEGRRLVQAFVASESANAVPMDQVLVTAGEKPPVFMLPKGKYRFAFQE